MRYLFGNILPVPTRDIWFMAGMDLMLLSAVSLFYRQFLAVAFRFLTERPAQRQVAPGSPPDHRNEPGEAK